MDADDPDDPVAVSDEEPMVIDPDDDVGNQAQKDQVSTDLSAENKEEINGTKDVDESPGPPTKSGPNPAEQAASSDDDILDINVDAKVSEKENAGSSLEEATEGDAKLATVSQKLATDGVSKDTPDPKPSSSGDGPSTSADNKTVEETGNTDADAKDSTKKTKSEDKDSNIACVTLDSDSDEAGDRPGSASAANKATSGVKIPRCCVNPDCKSREGLVAATSADLVYFRMVHGDSGGVPERVWAAGRRVRVCRTCHSLVERYQQAMAEILREGRPLLEGAVRQKEDEVCLDSDGEDEKDVDEAEDDGSASDDSSASILEVDSDIEAQIQAAMAAVQFDDQLEKCLDWVQRKQADIDESFSKTERDLARLDKDVNYLYEDLYKERPPSRSLPPVDIYHTGSQRTVRYPDGRVYDLDPAWTARYEPGRAMPPPSPRLLQSLAQKQQATPQPPPRPPPLQPKPGATLPTRGRPPTAGRSPGDKPAGDVLISGVVQVAPGALPSDLPPLGTILRPPVKPGELVFAMHSDQLSPWFRAKVKTMTVMQGVTRYRIKFETPRVTHNKNRVAEGSELAYMEQSSVRLHVGVRVVAAYRDHDYQTPTFYSGTVAEAPKTMNGYRYLVFFDDGYAAYVRHNELKLVVSPSKNVAEDVHSDCREFVAKYLAQFPERPMVKLQPGQVVKTELSGRWLPARVQAVDASLVKMVFETERPSNSEWIYRGSTRLAPMYAELVPTQPRKLGTGARRNIHNTVNVGKKNRVYVEYTRHSERDETPGEETGGARVGRPPRAVARKSTASTPTDLPPEPAPADRLISPISPMEGDGQIIEIANKPRVTPRRLQPHTCSRGCIRNFSVDMEQLKGSNPLTMPMMSGWIREIVRHRTSKRTVLYRAPCGRRLRSLAEVFSYLRLTGCQLEIDCFCFDFWVHCFTEFVPARKFCSIKDISYGKENVPVSCVNSLDRDFPEYVEYSTRRLPTRGVHLNLAEEFLTCCDCTDDCRDKSKCSCWQSTIQGTEFGPSGQRDNDAGYHFRRLINGNVITGIYECNDRCRCKRTCLNRVCQHPLRLRLQVFKTLRRGWGIRCLDDIPKGGFICVYAGQLLTESGANEDGKNYGDEYLAELDYIEVLERLKEGYESDVVDEEESSDEKQDEEKSDDEASPDGTDTDAAGDADSDSGRRGRAAHDDDFVPARIVAGTGERDLRRSNRARHPKAVEEEETKKKKITAAKTVETKKTTSPEKPPSADKKANEKGPGAGRLSLPDEDYKSVREQFGTDEYCYIMDAKNIGNLGRYLNHCCSPNVFVQNVFVDTHDLRFPWVAFFALSYIRAGTELTWDYNYEVGSVPGKVMYCHCGSQECRGRLL